MMRPSTRAVHHCILVLFSLLLETGCGAEAGIGRVLRPEEYVNVKIGAIGERRGQKHSTGNTLPLVARPWGFNHWAPQTEKHKTSWWSDMDGDTIYGVRCTHQPSPWMGDYAWFLISPYFGSGDDGSEGFAAFFDPDAMRPWKMDLTVGPSGTRMEFAPTNHGGIMRVTFSEKVPVANREICVRIPRGGQKDNDEAYHNSKKQTSGRCQSYGFDKKTPANNGGIGVISRRFADGVTKSSNHGISNKATFDFYARLQADVDTVVTEADIPDKDGCFDKDFQWSPLNLNEMDGRSTEDSMDHCQARCKRTSGCAHFTFWSDGGCHIQGAGAHRESQPGVTCGPPFCVSKAPEIRQCCFQIGNRLQAEIKVGTSFISFAQAEKALQDEVKGETVDSVSEAGRLIWRSMLQRVDVVDAGPPVEETWHRLKMFYTSLYRVLLFPRRLDELTPEGVQHWSPYDGQVHPGIGVTDNGLWDTFRTVYPLLTLAYPKELGEILSGWLNAFQTGGWLPKWASPGYRDSMIGTYADVTLADAIVKDISGFDRNVAWAAIKKDAYSSPDGDKDTSKGKFGLRTYKANGYLAVDGKIPEACSRTLDFAFADAASAEVAKRLNHHSDADDLRKRSETGLRALFHNGLMGRRNQGGDFKVEPAETWGDCFCEGNAWHHSFPPFNLEVLADLHGGKAQLLKKLHELFETNGTLQVGSYKVLIHEMREARMLGMGQYAHNNQPSHHLPYLFAQLGEPHTTALLVRRIMNRCYSEEGFSGDEDNGEMGAWYVLSALGLFATAVGINENYVLGAVPLFPRIWLRDLNIFIEAPRAWDREPLADQILWDGKLLDDDVTSIAYSKLRTGGTLRFASGAQTDLDRISQLDKDNLKLLYNTEPSPLLVGSDSNHLKLLYNTEPSPLLVGSDPNHPEVAPHTLRDVAAEYGNPERLLIYWVICLILFGIVAFSLFFFKGGKAKIRDSGGHSGGRRQRQRRYAASEV